MKYDELTEEAKRASERNIHDRIKDTPEYEAFLKALFASLSSRYEFDEDGRIIDDKSQT
ncbi:hypothetical protein [Paenisporosarcina sp. NPDC076898]|uniref:hypothetical protein n=1 Tax=unclassified Paenisporosarcina TaxID=2642018 RepID=UPI003D02C020